MSSINHLCHIQNLSVDNVSWTPVTAPADFNFVSIYNTDTGITCNARTDKTDSTTQIPIPALLQFVLNVKAPGGPYRFPTNTNIIYLQAASGGPLAIVVTWH